MKPIVMNLKTLMLGALLVAALPLTAFAQENGTANAEAREQYGALAEEAGALADMADAASLMQAAGKYLEAAELAASSGDEELTSRVSNARQQAVKAYIDAGSLLASADDHAAAAEAFSAAAKVAHDLEDAELEAKARYNASVAYVSLEDFENALTSIDSAIVLVPADLNYLYVKGVTLSKAGDMDGAGMAFARLDTLAAEAGDTDMVEKARSQLGRSHLVAANGLVKEKNYSGAIEHLDLAAPYLGEDDRTLNTLYATAYYRLGADQVQKEQLGPAESNLKKGIAHAQKAGQQKLVSGIQQQLDYIEQVKAHNQR